jgi:hypothetical protein
MSTFADRWGYFILTNNSWTWRQLLLSLRVAVSGLYLAQGPPQTKDYYLVRSTHCGCFKCHNPPPEIWRMEWIGVTGRKAQRAHQEKPSLLMLEALGQYCFGSRPATLLDSTLSNFVVSLVSLRRKR